MKIDCKMFLANLHSYALHFCRKHEFPAYANKENIIAHIEESLREVLDSLPEYCEKKICKGAIPFTCDCGCQEGSKRCNGINHL